MSPITGAPHGADPSAAPVDLTTLEEISLLLSTKHLPETLSEELFGRLLDLFGASAGSIYLHDDDAELWRAAPRERLSSAASEVMEQAARAVASGAQAFVGPQPDERRARPHARGHILAVPVTFNAVALGSFVLVRPATSMPFDARDVGLATSLAAQFGVALERARAQRELDIRVAQIDLIQRQLDESAEDVRQALESEHRSKEELAGALVMLQQTYAATVRGLAIAVEAKDGYTAGHLKRVTRYASLLARLVAPAQASDRQLEFGFLLHDVGKLRIPDALLRKKRPLTLDEWRLMRRHPEMGREILDDIPFLERAKEIVYAHHERWDGDGYPRGLKGLDIPLGARVFPVADAFDAMTSDRPYRKRLGIEQARKEIERGAGSQFWPEAVDAFLSIPAPTLREIGAADPAWHLVVSSS